jgi:hypothetical protein
MLKKYHPIYINTHFNPLLWVLILFRNIVESIIDTLERVRVLELEEGTGRCSIL